MKQILSLIVTLIVSTPAFAKNQEIHDFHFSTCNGTQCLELWSATGEMSQLQFSFSTLGATRVRVFDQTSKADSSYEGIASSYLPALRCITLAKADGGSLVISLETFKSRIVPGKGAAMTFKTLSLLAIAAVTLAACAPKNGESAPTGAQAPVSNGTGSLGGGGNGIDEKMLESYAISIDTLPEYRRYIEPLIRKIGRGRGDILTTYMKWGVKQKIWYMIPRPLTDLSHEQIGTGFSTDQYALNNDARVYIAKASYAKMDHKERANLLMHEIVMSARLLMKKTPKEQCEKLAGAQVSACTDPDMMKLAEAVDVSEADRGKMDTPDHDAVRAMTIFLMQHPEEVSASTITAKRRELGFVFPWDKAVSNVTAADLRLAIDRAKLSGQTFAANANIRPFKTPTPVDCKLGLQSYSDDVSYLSIDAGIAQEFPWDYPSTSAPAEWAPVYLKHVDQYNQRSNIQAYFEFANISILEENVEAQGVVDPLNGRQVVDRIRLRPILNNEDIPRLIHQQTPVPFTQVEIYLTRDDVPRISRISVRKLTLHYTRVNPDERAITRDDWEFVPNVKQQFSCTPIAVTNTNSNAK